MAGRALRWGLALLVSLAASGCAGSPGTRGSSPGTAPAEQARVSVLPGTSLSTTTAVPAPFEFVDYQVSGGTGRANDSLKIYPDGRATYDDGVRVVNFTVTPATVAELRAALERADLLSLPPVDANPPNEAASYRVIFGGRSVRFHDGTVPAALGPAVAILNRELARAKSGR